MTYVSADVQLLQDPHVWKHSPDEERELGFQKPRDNLWRQKQQRETGMWILNNGSYFNSYFI